MHFKTSGWSQSHLKEVHFHQEIIVWKGKLGNIKSRYMYIYSIELLVFTIANIQGN